MGYLDNTEITVDAILTKKSADKDAALAKEISEKSEEKQLPAT